MDVLRTAEQPLTAREIAERVLVAANIKTPHKAVLADLVGAFWRLYGITRVRVQRTNEGSPARWRIHTT